jgi:hypothetical protein
MTTKSSSTELTEIAHRHAAAEAAGDLAGTLATLEPESVYELYPVGLQLRGLDRARRYYEYFFAQVVSQLTGYRLVSEAVADFGVVQEYDVDCRVDGAIKTFRVLGILKFGTRALSGERLYADTEFLRILFGPLWAEMEPIGSDR